MAHEAEDSGLGWYMSRALHSETSWSWLPHLRPHRLASARWAATSASLEALAKFGCALTSCNACSLATSTEKRRQYALTPPSATPWAIGKRSWMKVSTRYEAAGRARSEAPQLRRTAREGSTCRMPGCRFCARMLPRSEPSDQSALGALPTLSPPAPYRSRASPEVVRSTAPVIQASVAPASRKPRWSVSVRSGHSQDALYAAARAARSCSARA